MLLFCVNTNYNEPPKFYNTGRFIMFSVITNIYNKKTKGPTLMEFFAATGKLNKFFWQLEMFDLSPVVIFFTAAMIRAFRHGSLQQWRISMHPCWHVCGKNLNIVSMRAVSPVVHTSNISSCQKNFLGFPVAVKNSIKVGPLVFLL
jgi:hypothetical protein